MSEELNTTVGSAAGKIWEFLDRNGEASASRLAEETGLNRNDVQRAIGWLAREGKLRIERRGRYEFFALAAE
ncbi:MAG TPA: winged helix-turn-helix domain-containing protein [Methylococcus sp.]|nr:winged helix-turn-helix domain-containing protein [Methylococcus sp.]